MYIVIPVNGSERTVFGWPGSTTVSNLVSFFTQSTHCSRVGIRTSKESQSAFAAICDGVSRLVAVGSGPAFEKLITRNVY